MVYIRTVALKDMNIVKTTYKYIGTCMVRLASRHCMHASRYVAGFYIALLNVGPTSLAGLALLCWVKS